MKLLIYPTLFLLSFSLTAQSLIPIDNASFEWGMAQRGQCNSEIPGWVDCGSSSETSPDIHSELSEFFGVEHSAAHGFNYLMLVTRDNGTHEIVSSSLVEPILKDSTYVLSIHLAKPSTCISRSKKYEINMEYNQAVVIRVFGGNRPCQAYQLLAESPAIEDTDWNEHQFLLLPKKNFDFLFIQAYYANEDDEPYNGSVLLDNFSLQSYGNQHQAMHKMIPSGKQYEWASALKIEKMVAEVVPEGLERLSDDNIRNGYFYNQYPSLVFLHTLMDMEHHFTLKRTLNDLIKQSPSNEIELLIEALRHIHAYSSAKLIEETYHYFQLEQSAAITKREAAFHLNKGQDLFQELLTKDEIIEKRIRYIITNRSKVLHQLRFAMIDVLGGRDILNLAKKEP